mmetsp:Transcript_36442/g.85192  ORF Transcript_36442/g.85192 Transcript_36442/m.85192 type:complete len:424 (+) Transcript_36442:52-1323(+)
MKQLRKDRKSMKERDCCRGANTQDDHFKTSYSDITENNKIDKHAQSLSGQRLQSGDRPTSREKSSLVGTEYIYDKILCLNLGDYARQTVSNLPFAGHLSSSKLFDNIRKGIDISVTRRELARKYFDAGLMHAYSYNHQISAVCFLKCLEYEPDAIMAHWGVSYAHSPNYNFEGVSYYGAAHATEFQGPVQENNEHFSVKTDALSSFPSPKIADKHIKLGLKKAEQLKNKIECDKIRPDIHDLGILRIPTEVEIGILEATSLRTSRRTHDAQKFITEMHPKIGETLQNIDSNINSSTPSHIPLRPDRTNLETEAERLGGSYANALSNLYHRFPHDNEVAFLYADSLMVLHAWKLYEHPSKSPSSSAAEYCVKIRQVIQEALTRCPTHPGLCHLWVHFCEMGPNPGETLSVCKILRERCVDCLES